MEIINYPAQFNARGTITGKQVEIVKLTALGLSQKEIAAKLFLPLYSVAKRLQSVRMRFPNVKPIHIPLLAYREGVVTLEELMQALPEFKATKKMGRKREFEYGEK